MAKVFKRVKRSVEERRTERTRWVPLKVEVFEALGSLIELYHFNVQMHAPAPGEPASEMYENLVNGYEEFRKKLESGIAK